jgi:hypothetical protein
MRLREQLAEEMETARQGFHHLVDSVPESAYSHPSENPAWTIGDVLYHITLGPPALQFEISMIRYFPSVYPLVMNRVVTNLFNRVNAIFTGRPKRINRQMLIQSYENGHAGLVSSLSRMRDTDFQRSVSYPPEFVSDLAGTVSIERLFHYVKGHFDTHEAEIRKKLGEILV